MLKFSRIALMSALLLVATGVGATGETPVADKPAALVNGVAIPQSRVELLVKYATAPGEQQQQDTPELRKRILEDLVTNEVLSQAAIKGGLDKQPDVMQQVEYSKQSILSNAFAMDYIKTHPIDEEVMRQDYEAMKVRVGNTEYKISYIQVLSEDEAKAVLKLLKKEKFAKVAKLKSKDIGNKDNGGELGWRAPASLPQPLAEVITKLSKGQVSEPVQMQNVWFVIKLDDTRELKMMSFEEMKPNIEKNRKQQAIMKAVAEIREKAKVE